MWSCRSILECCVTFSGVKLSIRSFVLFLFAILIQILICHDINGKADILLLILSNHTYLAFVEFFTQFCNKQVGIISVYIVEYDWDIR